MWSFGLIAFFVGTCYCFIVWDVNMGDGIWNLEDWNLKKNCPLRTNIDEMPYIYDSLDCSLLIPIYTGFGVWNMFGLKVERFIFGFWNYTTLKCLLNIFVSR